MGPVNAQRVPGGVVHELPADLREALIANATALDAWKDITPLARNEFICWVEDAKRESTRERRSRRRRRSSTSSSTARPPIMRQRMHRPEEFDTTDPLADLAEAPARSGATTATRTLPAFTGGLVGYAGYDTIRYYEGEKLAAAAEGRPPAARPAVRPVQRAGHLRPRRQDDQGRRQRRPRRRRASGRRRATPPTATPAGASTSSSTASSSRPSASSARSTRAGR